MSPSMAKLRIETYAKKYGKKTVKKLRERVLEIEAIQKDLSCYSKRYRLLAQEVFELNTYANSLEEVKKHEQAAVRRPVRSNSPRSDGLRNPSRRQGHALGTVKG